MASRDAWAHAAGFALLSVLLVGTLWTIPYLPTNDGPESVLAVHMENHFRDPGVIYPTIFAPAPQFAGRGFTVLFEPLEEWLGWQRGLQVALSIIVLLEAWGVVALIRVVSPRRLPLAFVGFPMALSWSLYMGFFAFTMGLGLGLFVLAFALRAGDPTPVDRVLAGCMLLVVAFCHMFAGVLIGVVLATTAVARAPSGRRLGELARVGITGLPAAGLAIAAVVVGSGGATKTPFAADFFFLPLSEALASWPRTLVPGPLGRALVVTLVVVACAGLAARRAVGPDTEATDRAFGAIAVIFLAASVVCPRDVPGWQCFSERFVWIGAVLLVAALPFERASSRILGEVVFAVSLGWTLVSYPFHRRLAAESADAIAGLHAKVERHGVWLPVTLAPLMPSSKADVPFLAPLHHIGALYATALGGLTPYTFASNPASWPWRLRPDAPRPPPVPLAEDTGVLLGLPELETNAPFRHKQENILATFGMFYEGVLVTGARPDDVALWHRRGFVADWEQGSVMVAHFEPCPVDVTVPRDAPVPQLDVGVGGTMVQRDAQLAPVIDRDVMHLVAPHGPCGKIWARPHWSAATPGDAHVTFCKNATATGEIEGTVTHSGGTIVCSGMSTPSP